MRGDHRRFTGKSPHAALQQRVVLHGPAALTQNQADDGTRRQRARTATSERRNIPRRHGQDGARESSGRSPAAASSAATERSEWLVTRSGRWGDPWPDADITEHAERSGAARIIAGVLSTAPPTGLGINVTVSTSCEESQDHEERVSQSRT